MNKAGQVRIRSGQCRANQIQSGAIELASSRRYRWRGPEQVSTIYTIPMTCPDKWVSFRVLIHGCWFTKAASLRPSTMFSKLHYTISMRGATERVSPDSCWLRLVYWCVVIRGESKHGRAHRSENGSPQTLAMFSRNGRFSP